MDQITQGGTPVPSQPSVEVPVAQAVPPKQPDLTEQYQQLAKARPLPVVTFQRGDFLRVDTGVALAGEAPNSVEFLKAGRHAQFPKPTFVTEVIVEGRSPGRELMLRCTLPNGDVQEVPFSRRGHIYTARVHAFVTAVCVFPDGWKPSSRASERLALLIVRGHVIEDLYSMQDSARSWCSTFDRFAQEGEAIASTARSAVSDLLAKEEQNARTLAAAKESAKEAEEQHKANVAAIAKEAEQLKAELTSVGSQLTPKKEEIAALEARKVKADAERAEAEKSLLKVKEEGDSTRRDVEARKEESKQLTREIAADRAKLKALKADISAVATEMKEYGSQGFKQAGVYCALVAVLSIAAYFITMAAFAETDAVWAAYKANQANLSVWVLAGLKSGPVLILGTILSGISYSIYFLVRSIAEIFSAKLRFSEISIFTKSSIDISMAGSDYSDDERNAAFHATRLQELRFFVLERIRLSLKAKGKGGSQPALPTDVESLLGFTKQLMSKDKPEG